MRLITFWWSHGAELAGMLERHLLLVMLSTAAAILVGVPAGVLAAHRPRLGRPVLVLANVAQTIPSLALLGFLLPLPFIGGVGPRTAIVALILYALLPIVRSTVAGLNAIDPAVIEAGIAMGMTRRQLLRLVELPLALPSIVAGIRVATVVTIGTATIAAAVGAGGLGEYIFRGLSMVDATVILAGAVPAAILALAADAVLTWIERQLAPGRTRRSGRRLALAGATTLAVSAGLVGAAVIEDPAAVVVGSKNFTEQVILGELIAQTLEARGIPVTRRLNLGGTFVCDQAIRAGDIDVYVEYTGTALTAILKQPVNRDADAVLNTTRELYAGSGLSVLPPLGFNNTFAILVRQDDAAALGLRSIGDLQRAPAGWTPGFGYEFVERADGYRGLAAAYGLHFAREPRVMDLTLMYRALANREIDLAAGDATSALIDALKLTQLEDDRAYFPPYHAVPIVRSTVVLRSPAVRAALEALAGGISEGEMRALNYAVDVEHRDVAVTVREFLGRGGQLYSPADTSGKNRERPAKS
jgi:osmoprotectant transport system permease protein